MAICMSLLQTAMRHDLNPAAYMRYVLDERASNPKADASGLLPHHLPPDIQAKLKRQGETP